MISVAPFVGAWIEILLLQRCLLPILSLPLWERGLKFVQEEATALTAPSRSLCGSVD